jgi:GPI ethanolamine phosphate transferase 3 subunit O
MMLFLCPKVKHPGGWWVLINLDGFYSTRPTPDRWATVVYPACAKSANILHEPQGGASIEEDSWIEQLKTTPYAKRGLSFPSRLGFVGDDTWVDLYPRQFDESFPFPSFNTRDLDTVDNGCLERIPRLLKHLRMRGTEPEELEVIVSHFLGVDHVGHTYGPHDRHMAEKLNQMDVALATTLDVLDASRRCHLTLIFGDHGMTEDGNHGGGTENEINAALFVHFSPACGDMSLDLTPSMGSRYIEDAFQSIHQIDLVPTISILLGLPIPYANLGGIVPSLLGLEGVSETAAAFALNAAQVWRYFTVYSETANQLPNLPELKEQLDEAVTAYKQALAHEEANDSQAFYKACGLFKLFLVEAADLGHRVWTRFDTFGMTCGGLVLFVTLVIWAISVSISAGSIRVPQDQYVELGLSVVFVAFQSGILSFSNSYIEAEQRIVMFMLEVLGVALFIRMHGVTAGGNARITPYIPLLVPLLSRIAELVISGHGQDPSIRLHLAHNPIVFLGSLAALLGLRLYVYRSLSNTSRSDLFHAAADCVTLLFLSQSWIEKRNADQARNGYLGARVVIALLLCCTPIAIVNALQPLTRRVLRSNLPDHERTRTVDSDWDTRVIPNDVVLVRALAVIFKLLTAVMVVTGPSTAANVLIASIQGWMMYILAGATVFYEVSSPVQATLWRLLVRHTFFATNHGCAFNRLQYSAAFVASMEFDFALGGLQLFLNTFGWEIVGLFMVWITSSAQRRPCLWTWYGFYQVMESFLNCISVSILRRHLMVWAVFAPRFLFSSVFLILNCFGQVAVYLLSFNL